jgi:hypothetical protein
VDRQFDDEAVRPFGQYLFLSKNPAMIDGATGKWEGL